MSIYTSTKVMPYVYMCVHKITGEFYIGYREANTTSSSDDLPNYKTSSKIVKPNFDEYDWHIVAEFYDGNAAYDFEQQLINEHWDNPLLLNICCQHSKQQFRRNGPHSEETKRKISEANKGNAGTNKGKSFSEETKQKMSKASKGKPSNHKGKPHSDATKRKLSEAGKARSGKPHSDATKRKLSAAGRGKTPWNKGKSFSEESRQKMSAAATLRWSALREL